MSSFLKLVKPSGCGTSLVPLFFYSTPPLIRWLRLPYSNPTLLLFLSPTSSHSLARATLTDSGHVVGIYLGRVYARLICFPLDPVPQARYTCISSSGTYLPRTNGGLASFCRVFLPIVARNATSFPLALALLLGVICMHQLFSCEATSPGSSPVRATNSLYSLSTAHTPPKTRICRRNRACTKWKQTSHGIRPITCLLQKPRCFVSLSYSTHTHTHDSLRTDLLWWGGLRSSFSDGQQFIGKSLSLHANSLIHFRNMADLSIRLEYQWTRMKSFQSFSSIPHLLFDQELHFQIFLQLAQWIFLFFISCNRDRLEFHRKIGTRMFDSRRNEALLDKKKKFKCTKVFLKKKGKNEEQIILRSFQSFHFSLVHDHRTRDLQRRQLENVRRTGFPRVYGTIHRFSTYIFALGFEERGEKSRTRFVLGSRGKDRGSHSRVRQNVMEKGRRDSYSSLLLQRWESRPHAWQDWKLSLRSISILTCPTFRPTILGDSPDPTSGYVLSTDEYVREKIWNKTFLQPVVNFQTAKF